MKIKAEITKTFDKDERFTLRAIGILRLDDVFLVKSIRIFETEKGLRVSMPTVTNSEGELCYICHSIDKKMSIEINDAFIEAYNKKIENPHLDGSADNV